MGTDWSPAHEDIQAASDAVQADLTAYKSAQVTKDDAQTAQLNAANSQIGQNKAAIEQFRSTKADKTEVLGLVRTTLQSEWRSDMDATKTELTRLNTLTNAKITALEQTVGNQNSATATRLDALSASLNNLNVGGRNLLLKSNVGRTTLGTSTYAISPNVDLSQIRELVLSVDIDVENFKRNITTTYSRIGAEIQVFYDDEPNTSNFVWFRAWFMGSEIAQTSKQRLIAKLKIPNDKRIAKLTYNKVQIHNATFDRAEVKNIKLETGNVATDWTPAPEDAQSVIDVVQAELTAHKSAQATADQAQTSEINAAKSRIGTAEASIRTTQTTLTTLNGKVQSMYSLKVQAVGSRKAVAGLALGADGATGDSQMIVMADKFALAQPNTQSIQAPFVVTTVNGQAKMALNGDFVADGTILGKHIAASQTIQAPIINGGSLNIGNGRFVVNHQGQVGISAANGNVGMKINNDFIAVYDEHGRLRVKLGKLS